MSYLSKNTKTQAIQRSNRQQLSLVSLLPEVYVLYSRFRSASFYIDAGGPTAERITARTQEKRLCHRPWDVSYILPLMCKGTIRITYGIDGIGGARSHNHTCIRCAGPEIGLHWVTISCAVTHRAAQQRAAQQHDRDTRSVCVNGPLGLRLRHCNLVTAEQMLKKEREKKNLFTTKQIINVTIKINLCGRLPGKFPSSWPPMLIQMYIILYTTQGNQTIKPNQSNILELI